jgi:hypothetical protein
VTLTLSVPAGSLSATSGSGVAVGGSARALTLTGTIDAINAFLAASGVTYRPASGGGGSVALTLVVVDNGGSGAGGALSAKATTRLDMGAVAPVVEAPATPPATIPDVASETTDVPPPPPRERDAGEVVIVLPSNILDILDFGSGSGSANAVLLERFIQETLSTLIHATHRSASNFERGNIAETLSALVANSVIAELGVDSSFETSLISFFGELTNRIDTLVATGVSMDDITLAFALGNPGEAIGPTGLPPLVFPDRPPPGMLETVRNRVVPAVPAGPPADPPQQATVPADGPVDAPTRSDRAEVEDISREIRDLAHLLEALDRTPIDLSPAVHPTAAPSFGEALHAVATAFHRDTIDLALAVEANAGAALSVQTFR